MEKMIPGATVIPLTSAHSFRNQFEKNAPRLSNAASFTASRATAKEIPYLKARKAARKPENKLNLIAKPRCHVLHQMKRGQSSTNVRYDHARLNEPKMLAVSW